jgi:hypothetical protein
MGQQPVCAIGGTVVESAGNQPVARARVIAVGTYSLLKLTDDRGGFCFQSLDPGDYHILVQKAGYQEEVYPVTLAVEADSVVKPLSIRMTHYGSLSGLVVDSAGEPLAGAHVTVWDRARGMSGWGPEEVDSVNADGRGVFRFSQVLPGTYYLSVNQAEQDGRRFAFPFLDSDGQPMLEKEVETFYNGAFTFDAAAPVEVQAGQHVDDLMLTLRKARLRRVSGHVANPPKTGFLTYDGGSDLSGAIPIAKDGSFVQTGIAPGPYTLRLTDGERTIAQKDVDLTDGDALGVILEPVETIDVPVTFRTEGKGPAFRPRGPGVRPVVLVADDSGEAVVLKRTNDGTYRFAEVPRGIYRLRLELAGQAFYLKGVTYGGETQTGNKVDLRSSRQGGLEVTVSSKVASLQGRATPAEGVEENQSQNLTVLLVDGDQGSIAMQTGTDQKGRFQLRTVAPGKYRVFAVEGFDGEAWNRAGLLRALAAKAVDVELKESDKKQVSVTVISAGEWKAALKNIGE